MWNKYVRRTIAGKNFTAAAYTCLNYIDGFHRLSGERMPSDNVQSADFRIRAISILYPFRTNFIRKLGFKRVPWQFFNDFTGSTSGFAIRKRSKIFFPLEKI